MLRGPKSKDFWPKFKPFLSQKSILKNSSNIILKKNESLIANQTKVCDMLNDYCVNIAKNIGINDQTDTQNEHPSIKLIKQNNSNIQTFNFSTITSESIEKPKESNRI